MSLPVSRPDAPHRRSSGRPRSQQHGERGGRTSHWSRPWTLDDVLFAGLMLGLAWAPFWFGGNRPLAWMVNIIAFSALMLAYELSLARARAPYPVSPLRIWVPLALFALVGIWILLQSSTHLPARLDNGIWGLAQEALSRAVPGAISIDPDTTRLGLLTLLPPVVAFWLALQLGRETRRARLLIFALALISSLYAVYALVALHVFPGTLLWFTKVDYIPFATSTFVNRNSYATYAGLGVLSCICALSGQFAGTSSSRSSVWRRWATVLLTRGAVLPCLLFFGLALNLLALMLSVSRAGIACSLAAIVIFFVLSAWRTGFRWFQLAALAIVGVLILSVVSGFDDLVSSRVAAQGFVDPLRWAIVRLSGVALMDRPLLGFGFATFEEAFRIYRDASIVTGPGVDKAHNTYIEAMLGLGLPAFAMVMTGLAMLVSHCIKGVRARRKDAEIPILAVTASVLVAAHALVDFSMQMQGVAITFAMILGVGLSQSWPREAPRPEDDRRSSNRRDPRGQRGIVT